MKINCVGARATMTELDLLASGTANYFSAEFTFDSSWDSLTYRWAVFKGSRQTEMAELVNNSCFVPHEVLTNATELFVGAIGMNTNDPNAAAKILTTNMTFVCKVPEGASTSATISNENQTVLQQLLQAIIFVTEQEVWEEYDPNKDYYVGNKVYYSGNSYYCKANITAAESTTPDVDTDYWVMIVSGGSADNVLGTYTKKSTYQDVTSGDSIRSAIEKVEGQTTLIKDSLTGTQEDLIETQDSLTATQNSLTETQEDLDKTQIQLVVAQNDIKILENTVQSLNPNGDAKITVASFDTVNSLPKNAAQAGLGVVQEGMTVTNLTDGDFSATADWNSNFATFTVANGVASFLANAQNQNAQQPLTAIATHKYYVRAYVKTTTGTTDIAIRFYDGTNTTDTAIANSTAWQKVSAIITAGASGAGFVGLVDKRASAWDTIQIKEFRTVNLTAIAKQAATLSQADAMLLDYFSGTQSAVTGRVRSVGTNQFDGILETGTLDASGVNAVDATKIRSKNYSKVKPSTAYVFSNGSSYTALTASFYDRNRVFIGQSAVNYATFTTPALTHFIRFQTTGTNTSANIQLEFGTTATTFLAHAKTESYTKPMLLRRLPNNTLDDVTNGKHTKRVSNQIAFTGAETWRQSGVTSAFYLNVSGGLLALTPDIKLVSTNTIIGGIISPNYVSGIAYDSIAPYDDVIYISTDSVGVKDTTYAGVTAWKAFLAAQYAANTPITFYYELTTPIVTENVSSGTLLAYPSGTVYWEPVVADVAIYATGASILNTGYPISSLESIYKIDLVTGEQTPLAVANATVASGGLSFTHTGLVNGDLVGFTYYFSHPYPYGENDYTYYDNDIVVEDATTKVMYKWSITLDNGIPTLKLVSI